MTRLRKSCIFIALVLFVFPSMTQAFSFSDIETINQKYGLDMSQQSFCIADDTSTLFQYNADTLRFPASVSKLYVTDWVLNTLPKDFRFKTQFVQKGNTLYILGGRDPQFISEHLWYVLYRVQSQTKTKINAIVFDGNTYFNWDYDALSIQKEMQSNLRNPAKISGGLLAQTRAKLLYKKDMPTRAIPSLSPKITVSFKPVLRPTGGVSYTLTSPARDDMLKYMNIYSSNSIANVLFDHLGGIDAFKTYMKKTYATTEQNFDFTTGSGLAANSVTCRLTISLLQHLRNTAQTQGVHLENIVAMPGEEGTLTNRLFGNVANQSVAMKTGNVWSHVTLAGFINTNAGMKYFVFLNNATGPTETLVNDTRKFQDQVLARYISEFQTIVFNPKDSKFLWANFVFKKN